MINSCDNHIRIWSLKSDRNLRLISLAKIQCLHALYAFELSAIWSPIGVHNYLCMYTPKCRYALSIAYCPKSSPIFVEPNLLCAAFCLYAPPPTTTSKRDDNHHSFDWHTERAKSRRQLSRLAVFMISARAPHVARLCSHTFSFLSAPVPSRHTYTI